MKHLFEKTQIGGMVVLALIMLWAGITRAADRDVVSIGGSVTEIIFALDQQDRLLARDSTSTWPNAAMSLPDVGYMRALSPEGVLSVGPGIIIAEDGAGPAEALDVLRAASITFVDVPDDASLAGIIHKIEIVGAALEVQDKADVLAQKVSTEMAAIRAEVAQQTSPKPRVLFILSTQGGRIMVGGTDTAADAVIGLAGGLNVIDSFRGYKPVTPEAIAAAAPDVILMMDRGGGHASSNADLWSMPALAQTPAAAEDAVVRIDGLLLLGFGPRTPQAVKTLFAALYDTQE